MLDRYDRHLLELVQQDNRISSELLASKVGLSPTAIQRRLAKLRKQKYIHRDVSIVPPDRVGRSMCFLVEITLEKESVDLLDKFKRQMVEEKEVQQCYYISGKVDFLLILNLPDMEAYESFVRRVIFENSNIQRFETNVVMNKVKVGLTVPID